MLKMFNRFLGLSFLLSIALYACASTAGHEIIESYEAESEKTEIIGWLKAYDEWELHPTPQLNAYHPIDSKGESRCIPLAIEPSPANRTWAKLNGKLVKLNGKFIPYSDLDEADSPVERALNRKYYAGIIIFNACLNDFVFEAESISLVSK